MSKLKNNNPSVKATRKKIQLKRLKNIQNAYNMACVTSVIVASTNINVFAATAPSGVSTGSMNKVIDIIFYILYAACAIYAASAAFSIVKGHNEEDPRTMKSGIAGAVIAAIVAGSLVAIKKAIFG